MRVENAFASELKLTHPMQRLAQTFRHRFKHADGRVGQKLFHPIQGFNHRQRRTEPAVVSDDMKKFINHQGWKNKAVAALRFGLHGSDGGHIRRMILQGELDEDIAIQASQWRPNNSSASSDWKIMGVKTR